MTPCVQQPELFFPATDGDTSTTQVWRFKTAPLAARLCAGCPRLEACRADAHKHRPTSGVWAGEVWSAKRNPQAVA